MTLETDRVALREQRGTNNILCRFRRYRVDEPHPILPFAPHDDHQYLRVPFEKLDEVLARMWAEFGDPAVPCGGWPLKEAA